MRRRTHANDDQRPQADERVIAAGSTPAIAEDAMGLERSEKPTVKPASASAIGFGSATLSSFSTGPAPARTIRARGGTWRWCCAGCAWTRTARGLARCSVGCDHTRTAATKVKESIESSRARVADALSLQLAHSIQVRKQRTIQGSPHFCRSEHPVPSELHPIQSRPSGMIKIAGIKQERSHMQPGSRHRGKAAGLTPGPDSAAKHHLAKSQNINLALQYSIGQH